MNENAKDAQLCDKIERMPNGLCAIRAIVPGGTTYQAKCFCRVCIDGDDDQKQSNKNKNILIDIIIFF